MSAECGLKSPLLPFLYQHLNFSACFVLPASFGKRRLSRRLLKQYTCPFADSTQRNGTLAFARSLLHDQDWFESLWERRHFIASKPVLLIWGVKDPMLSFRFLEKFASGFISSQVVRLEESEHFPQEEEPGRVANAICSFMLGQSIE